MDIRLARTGLITANYEAVIAKISIPSGDLDLQKRNQGVIQSLALTLI
jgi:hypothetical protein